MRAYALRRLALVVPTLVGLTILTFLLANLAPGDPAEEYLRRTSDRPPTEEEIQRTRVQLGIDRPLPAQYVSWVGRLVRGDMGTSFSSRRPVRTELARGIPYTFELALPAAVIALLLAAAFGTISAVNRNRSIDHVVRVAALTGASMPSFWLALLLIIVFAVHLAMVPVAGRGGVSAMVLPILTLAVGPAAVLSRFTRSAVLETLGEDYVRTARAKGLAGYRVVMRHALRNALVPVVTAFGLTLGNLLAGAVIVESIFGWPGVGRIGLDAIRQRDYPMVQGFVLYAGLATI
ncbi:MAG: ABC transporter permease, partial [Actinomycetota bacterium]|nr:ABC transporter permease [Actinomycetota bacterium]